ncbi:hypothetical protein PT974_08755 [Cladobotryum mycophilum]|uniref:Uncharacterized protein n=1 Tax=Cladobotryum mycophilum TaxID=491253 RepID=A0ABR0SE87_9HYPO
MGHLKRAISTRTPRFSNGWAIIHNYEQGMGFCHRIGECFLLQGQHRSAQRRAQPVFLSQKTSASSLGTQPLRISTAGSHRI